MKHTFIVLASVLAGSLLLAGCQLWPLAWLSNNQPTPVPAARPATISGAVEISGAVVQDSTILMLQRKPGEMEYTEFDRLPAENDVTFSWDGAVAGQKYEITAAGQVDEQNRVTSNAVTVTAPASDIMLTINTKLSLAAPSDKPSYSCGDPDSTGNYNVKLSFPPVAKAMQYYAQIGSQPGLDDVATELLPAKSGQSAEWVEYLKKDQEYYTRYAYTYCDDCKVDDPQNWSSWSYTVGFKCP
jgi:hypothetical protein